MNETEHLTLSPDDPRLTAYALGELDAAERAAVEAAVLASPALQAAVADVRLLAGDLSAALHSEASAEPVAAAALAPLAALAAVPVPPTAASAAAAPARGRRATVFRLPFSYYSIATLAAACFAVAVWIHRADVERRDLAKAQAETQPASAGHPAGPVAPAAARGSSGTRAAAAESPLEITFLPAQLASLTAPDEAAPGQSATATEPRPHAGLVTVAPAPLVPPFAPAHAPLTEALVRRQRPSPFDLPQASLVPDAPAPLLEQVQQERVAAREPKAGDNALPLQGVATAGGSAGPATTASPRTWASQPGPRDALAPRPRAGNSERLPHPPGGGPAPAASFAGPFLPSASAGAPLTPAVTTDTYASRAENGFLAVKDHPLSTFAADVDTASYAHARRLLESGRRPPIDAVRIEEWVNYFPYRYAPPPTADGAPFATHLEVASAPWRPEHRLVRIGLKGRELPEAARPAANLVFLLDVSGSMNAPNRLPLVKQSLQLLLQTLRPDDRVAIVTYAGQSGLALPSTPASRPREIAAALEALQPAGSTNGALGLHLAYDIAKAHFIPGGTNRVILCTDGDFNVGVTGPGELTRLVAEQAKSRVFLTVLGYGMGNYKDATLERLADRGNGNYGYIDTLREAQKILVEQVGGTLVTIARDVKLQVEFNPAKVAAYRLIGYENRLLAKEDFNHDAVDAGEIGAGHTVTALYEVVPAGVAWSGDQAAGVDALKYQPPAAPATGGAPRAAEPSGELLTVKIRYQAPDGGVSRKLEFPLNDTGAAFAAASTDFKFAAAVAGFGLLLSESPHRGTASFEEVIGWAEAGLADDAEGHRREFVALVGKALTLAREKG